MPSVALACIPSSPYQYPIQGAYLVGYFSAVIALALELFRLLVHSAVVRRRLRLAAYTFALILLIVSLLGCALRVFDQHWQQSLPTVPVGGTTLRC
ncbi:MAG: hypothetical protein IPJ68_02740 [Candidatus Moraniibacteriota bacterium]|nr:MAG: hypothetical protein IPJ68_02740 [Candidatus Moranbacteria bacterium]